MNNNFDYQQEPYYQQTVQTLDRVPLAMAKSYLFMMIALFISGVTAFVMAQSGLMYTIFASKGTLMGIIIAEFVIVFASTACVNRRNTIGAGLLFLAYSIINGITLSSIFAVFDLGSIATVFFIAAGMFAAMSVFGMVTKKNLSGVGQIGLMLLIGVIILGIVNIFVQSSGLQFGISVISLGVFIGLTAYDTQMIKSMAMSDISMSTTLIGLYGAFNLYLDLINIFLDLLQIFGDND